MENYTNIGLTVLLILGYIITIIFQGRQIKSLKSTLESQSTLITNLKDIFDLDELKKWYLLRLENKEVEIHKIHLELAGESVREVTGKFAKDLITNSVNTYKELLDKWVELRDMNIVLILSIFPKIDEQAERELYIRNKFPKNFQEINDRLNILFEEANKSGTPNFIST